MRIELTHTEFSDHLPASFSVTVDHAEVAFKVTHRDDPVIGLRSYVIEVDEIAAVTPEAMAEILQGARKANLEGAKPVRGARPK